MLSLLRAGYLTFKSKLFKNEKTYTNEKPED